MAKTLNFSNGEFFVGLDAHGQVKDVSFPYIGAEMHTTDNKSRIGVWIDDKISWVDSSSWTFKSRFPYGALVGHTVLTNKSIGVVLEFEDFIDTKKNIFVRSIHVINLRPSQRDIRLFLHQAFDISNSSLDDTAQFLPAEDAILHYRGSRAFVIGGETDMNQPADQHSIGLFGNGLDGTWRDAEDGKLAGCDVDSGQVDSTLRYSLTIGGLSSRRVNYWLCAATSSPGAIKLHKNIKQSGVANSLESTAAHWRKWMSPGFKVSEKLNYRYRYSFTQSLMRLKSHTDKRGAIVSSLADSREAYCSPREGAYIVWPLIRLGYRDEAQNFFDFCRNNLAKGGYLMSRYRADGSVAGSRLPYRDDLPPIQSDQMATVVFVFTQFYMLSKRTKLLNEYYASLIKPMANFLSDYTDEIDMPKVSYDFNDQKLQTSTYTAAITFASLNAAADLADVIGDESSVVKWRTAAETMREAAAKHVIADNGTIKPALEGGQPNIASFYGSFMFGLFEIDSLAVTRTASRLEKSLRFEHGLFARSADSIEIDYIGSIWMAQYYMESGRTDDAHQVLAHVSADISSGLIESDIATWTHAEFANALLDTLAYNK